MPLACESCEEWERKWEEVYKKRKEYLKKLEKEKREEGVRDMGEKMDMEVKQEQMGDELIKEGTKKWRGKCNICGKVNRLKIVSKRICKTCYSKMLKKQEVKEEEVSEKNLFMLLELVDFYRRKANFYNVLIGEVPSEEQTIDVINTLLSYSSTAKSLLEIKQQKIREISKILVVLLQKALEIELKSSIKGDEIYIYGDIDEMKDRFLKKEKEIVKERLDSEFYYLDDVIKAMFPEFERYRVFVLSDIVINRIEWRKIIDVLDRVRIEYMNK